MKIELRNLKIAASLSDETTAYTATVYVNGEKAFSAENHGQGGPDMYYPLGARGRELLDKAEAWAKTLPPEPSPYFPDGLPMDLELYIALMLGRVEEEKALKRWCKKGIVYRTPDTPKGRYMDTRRPYTREAALALRAKYPNITIYNEELGLVPSTK